jgi:hypothetical protein
MTTVRLVLRRFWLPIIGLVTGSVVFLTLLLRPSVTPPVSFPNNPFTISGAFADFWQQNNGATTIGPPQSAALWLDGQSVQYFQQVRLVQEQAPAFRGRIVSQPLSDSWQRQLVPEVTTTTAAPWRATLSALDQAQPLQPITVTLAIDGFSGSAELRLYDAQLRQVGNQRIDVRNGTAQTTITPGGTLGQQQAVVLIDGQVAGVASHLFTLEATTLVQTGQPRFDELFPRVQAFMEQDVTEYALNGMWVRGYRSPDNFLLWLRDHTYQARGFRYFERDMFSLIDAFRRAQRPDGSFPDWLDYPEFGIVAERKEVEADLEFLFVQAVYEAWQALGDDQWLRSNLEAMRRAVRYSTSDPLRWNAERGLVRRPYTIDMWDFEYGPTTKNPVTGKPAPRHWIDEQTMWGAFHGDNTGLAHALELLARAEEHVGDPQLAKEWRAQSDEIVRRLNRLSWNGRFYTHFVPEQPFDVPGVDEAEQLSISNTYALNRGILTAQQGRAIIDEYFRRAGQRGTTFAEWYSIDPPFPAGAYGLAGRKGENPGEYVNGGIMPLVGGELARGAFRYGAEQYGFDILTRYDFLIRSTGETYLWYFPEGNPGKSGPDTLPTDGWGSSAMLGALIEGAAGVEDTRQLYRLPVISPRWTASDDVSEALVVARYAASDGYVAYRWQRDPQAIRLQLTGSGETALVQVLLPIGVQAREVVLNGQPIAFETETVAESPYIRVSVPVLNSQIEVRW